MSYDLFEKEPALKFEDTHLLGNGSLGATVYGGVPYDKILINHDTLWSGEEQNKIHKGTKENFEKARELVLNEEFREANELINEKMVGKWSESFLPLGFVHLTHGNTSDVRNMKQKKILSKDIPYEDYERRLTLDDAVERITYSQDKLKIKREYFVSYDSDVVAMRISADKKELDLSVAIDSPLHFVQSINGNELVITGRAPDKVEAYDPTYRPESVYLEDNKSNALRFAMVVKISKTDGDLTSDGTRVYLKNATYIEMYVSATTNYKGYKEPRDKNTNLLIEICQKKVNQAHKKGYQKLMAEHLIDYQALYGRFSIDLGQGKTELLPTSQRLAYFDTIDDPSMSAFIMQYARYLLIASSRENTQPMNLQGIWNPNPCPMWASNYTTNINVQMCYWIAETLNLSELHQPLFDMIHELADSGSQVAKDVYGARGWLVHHNTDLWRMASVAGEDASWAWWPTAGLWLTNHLWEHFCFTQNQSFLKNAFPLFEQALEFICDFVVYDEKEKCYVTAPSTSPENKFVIPGHSAWDTEYDLEQLHSFERFSADNPSLSTVSKISTVDLTMIMELISNYEESCRILSIPVKEEVTHLAENLPSIKVGKYGQLQEWEQDFDECTPGMAHVSHLYGIYPAALIKPDNQHLLDAGKITLERRMRHGAMVGHWPGAWSLCLNARFKDSSACYLSEKEMGSGLGANLFTEETLQIDAAMGWAAGLSEMILQSHLGFHEVLPAIPHSWRKGEVTGLKARGDYVYDINWENNQLTSFKVTAKYDHTIDVAYLNERIKLTFKANESKLVINDGGKLVEQE